MQFAVPQFTEVEDRLIGSLTLKQFLVLLAAGAIDLFFWSVFGPTFPFYLVAIPISLIGAGIALGKVNGRPVFIYVIPLINYLTSTRVMVFRREAVVTTVARANPVRVQETPVSTEPQEPAESRLKKLAYLLDKKTGEEGDIISRDTRQDIIVPEAPRIDLTSIFSSAGKQIKDRLATAVHHPAAQKPARQPVAQTTKQPAKAPAGRPAAPKPSIQVKPEAKPFDPSSFLQI